MPGTYGGSWLYHWGDRMVSYGFVVGLDYKNTVALALRRDAAVQGASGRFASISRVGAVSATVRARSAKAACSPCPKLTFPGGALIGDTAGFLNVPKIKGTHTAMKSGMVAAEALAEALAGDKPAEPDGLRREDPGELGMGGAERRAQHPSQRSASSGCMAGIAYSALDTYVFRGKAPWTLHHPHPDNETLLPSKAQPIAYPKPDGVLTFDRLSSVFISNTNHEENQPVHLRLRDPAVWKGVNWDEYRSPESRYCPAGVYEAVGVETGAPRLQINAQNCVHCKTCDIKDPTQNIDWCVPEGGGGPNYPGGM